MKLVFLQRVSALVFLVAFVAHAHFVSASAPSAVQVALLSALVIAGVLHLGASVFFVGTDYVASRTGQWGFGALAALGSLAGALWPIVGVVGSSQVAPTPGHLSGAACARCHADAAADHARFSLDPHTEAGLGCESCHDVVSGTAPALERARPESGSACLTCHEDGRGGWVAPPSAPSADPTASASVVASEPVAPPGPPRLCAKKGVDHASALESAPPARIEAASGDKGKLDAGGGTVELRAALIGDELVIAASWRDATHDRDDRLALMLSPLAASPSFDKSGCALTCHAADTVVHRTAEGRAWEWDVTERAATARALTTTGYRLEPATGLTGRMARDGDAWTAELRLRAPDALLSSGAASMSVAVFDHEPKAHATKTKPIVLDLRCE